MSMNRQLANNLLRLAEIYRARVPQALATLSRLMARDSGLLERIASTDASFTIRKYDETVQRFANYWPDPAAEGGPLEWPADIPRPKRSEPKVQRVHERPSRHRSAPE